MVEEIETPKYVALLALLALDARNLESESWIFIHFSRRPFLKIWRRLLKKPHVGNFQKWTPNFQTALWGEQMNIYTCHHAKTQIGH